MRHIQAQRRAASVGTATVWMSLSIVLLGSLLLALTYSRVLHISVFVVWAGATAVLWLIAYIAPTVKTRQDPQTAALLERHYRDLRSNVTSSLEFGASLSGRSSYHPDDIGSPALMRAFVDKTADQLVTEAQRYKAALPKHQIGAFRKIALTIMVGFALACLVAPHWVRLGFDRLVGGDETETAITTPASDGPQVPLIASIYVRYDYPAYTRRSPIEGENLSGRIEVLAGTQIRLHARSLVDVTSAALVLTANQNDELIDTEIEMDLDLRNLRVSFPALQDATYRFEVIDGEGEHRVDPVQRQIRVIQDAPPNVRLNNMEPVIQAAADDFVPFHFTVSDDFGLTEIAFVHAFAGDEGNEERVELITLNDMLVFQESAGFDLALLNLQPRDEIVVLVEATDNDSFSGPNFGRSRPVLIRISAPEDRHLDIVEREDEIFEALLSVLGNYLENPIAELVRTSEGITFRIPDGDPDDFGMRYAAAQTIHRTVQTILGEMRDLLIAMENDELLLRRDFEIFESIYDAIYLLHRQEANVLSSISRAAARNTLVRVHMERIETVRVEQVRETEQAVLTLEELIGSQRMESMNRTLEEINELRQRLRELLEEYRDTQDPDLRAEIERELLRLEARLRELLERLAEQMDQLPPEHYNLEALQEMGTMSDVAAMTEALQRIRDMLEMGDIESALEALDNLEAEIEAMMQQLSESQQSGGGGLSELDQRMSELMDQINALEAQESAIEEDTAQLQEEIRQRLATELQEELESFVENARERVRQMRQELAGIETEGLNYEIPNALDDADDLLEDLEQMLGESDIEGALQRANAAREELMNADYHTRRARRRHPAGSDMEQSYGEAEETIEDVDADAQQLIDDLESLLQRAQPVPGPADQPRVDELSEAQQLTLDELGELLEQVSEFGQDMPMIQDELGPPLEQVSDFMEGARGQLENGRLEGARADEQSALDRLRQLGEQMSQMVGRERMQRRNSGPTSTERVEIPEEPDETPAEFREDILDAMRDQSLESYQEAIRQYYESLVE